MFLHMKKGFTLIEFMITFIIIVVLASLAAPSFKTYFQKRELDRIRFQLIQNIHYARSQAILHKNNIVLCPSANQRQCDSSAWNVGYLIYIDAKRNRSVDPEEIILKYESLDLKYGELYWYGALSTPSLTFQAKTGLLNGSNGTFYYCAQNLNHRYKIVLGRMVHPRIEQTTECKNS